MSAHPVQVHVSGDIAVIRVTGRMTFVEAHPLRKFCVLTMAAGLKRYILNASQCTSMDSTFIGVLAMVALKGKGRGVRVEICGANEQVSGQIRGLGLKRIFMFHDRCPEVEGSVESVMAPGDRAALRQTMLDAHEALVDVDARNAATFKDLLLFLREASNPPLFEKG